MATNMEKLKKRKNIIKPIIWKRGASRSISKGSTIVSCEMMIFVNVCSNMLEMKMFVLNGTILQNKISPIECQNQNIFDTDKIGGSLSISLETLADHWEKVLISTKHCLHWTVYTENLEDNNSGPCLTGSTSNGNSHQVLPPVGGNGVDPGGLPKDSNKVHERGCMQRFMIERGTRCLQIFFGKTSDERHLKEAATESAWNANESRDAWELKRQHLKRPVFAVWTITMNSHTSEKWIRGNTDDDWINDTKQNNKHNNMFNVAANLKHVHTHENNNWRLVSALCLFVCSLSSQLLLFPLSVDDSLCTHCGSSLWLVRLTVIAMFHAHVEWLFPSLHHL